MSLFSFIMLALICAFGISAQDFKRIKLEALVKTGDKPILDVFCHRHSDRIDSFEKFKPRRLSPPIL